MNETAKARPVLQRLKLRCRKPLRKAQSNHHTETDHRKKQRKKPGKPTAAETTDLDGRFQIALQMLEKSQFARHVTPPNWPTLQNSYHAKAANANLCR
jgi:hypothetical protein